MYSWKTVLVTIGLLFGLKVWNPYLVENITWSWFDFLHQQHEIEQVDNIVLVDIDEKSLEKYGQYPWPRNIYSDILFETHYSNTHVFTQLFKEPDRFQGDESFADFQLHQQFKQILGLHHMSGLPYSGVEIYQNIYGTSRVLQVQLIS